MPLGKFNVVDVTVLDDNVILHHKKVAALEGTLKHIRTRNFITGVQAIILALEAADKAGLDKESLSAAFRYIIDAKEKEDVMLFFDKIVKSELYKYEGEIMSYAELLKKEGRQEGAYTTQQKIVNNMLHSGFKPEEVANYTGISLQEVAQLQKNISY